MKSKSHRVTNNFVKQNVVDNYDDITAATMNKYCNEKIRNKLSIKIRIKIN